MNCELIVTTYNSPRALVLTLLSVALQQRLPDRICIADDGSGPETLQAIEAFGARFPHLRLRHIWHEDRGFRKNEILNRAIATSQADYLVFIDGDCLIHPGFIARHLALAHPRRFLSGSLIRLGQAPSDGVDEADILSGRVFDRRWLAEVGALGRFSTRLKAGLAPSWLADWLERIYPVGRNWCGANASAYRDAILKVNGLDETMTYGGEDKELGIRLENSGVRGRHVRFTAPLVHLEHPRSYRDPARIKAQREKLRAARQGKLIATPEGIVKAGETGQA